jgi:hypothetical protein
MKSKFDMTDLGKMRYFLGLCNPNFQRLKMSINIYFLKQNRARIQTVRAGVKYTRGLYIHNSASKKQSVIPEYLQPQRQRV